MSANTLSFLTRNWGRILDVLYPRSCVHCGGVLEGENRWLCAACEKEIERVAPPTCLTCGVPFYGAIANAHMCPNCVELGPVFSEGRTLFLHRGPIRSLIHALKYQSARYVLQEIRHQVAMDPTLADWLTDSALVPVPLHPKRERKRGYNQSALLAELFAEVTGQGRVERLLQRTRNTPQQTRLNREDRQRNMARAFELQKAAAFDAEARYVLVDDVFTTGATLNAAAQALAQAGAQQVRALTLAHG